MTNDSDKTKMDLRKPTLEAVLAASKALKEANVPDHVPMQWWLSERTYNRLQKIASGEIQTRRPAKGWRRHIRKMKAAKARNA